MCDTPCVDPEFLKGDANTKGGGGATYCFGRFPENCMKLKKKLNGGGGVSNARVPTRTGKPGKLGKMGRHFPVREKSGNFKQTGKVRENHTKY